MRRIESDTDHPHRRPATSREGERWQKSRGEETQLAQWLFYVCALALAVILAVILRAALREYWN